MSELSLSTGEFKTGCFILRGGHTSSQTERIAEGRTYLERVSGVVIDFVILIVVKLSREQKMGTAQPKKRAAF